jgi:hypothetical protein
MSILLGIDQSLDGRLTRGRRAKAARPGPGLIVVERVKGNRAAELRSPESEAGADCRNHVDARHDTGVAAKQLCYDARFGHDLPVLDGAARAAERGRGLLTILENPPRAN